ncbi:MAG: 2-C-methyl-D-erythritol 4-phosphate cytidylyltransferase [Dysgonamonadaceae bacterium]|nr:2-C-methyl-D-erythritol 4-phosphate cytidylyltransferase [Dysgonamonadaceae bacterium]
MTKQVIIVAGGKGARMGSELPKQFLSLGGQPVLMRTIEAFLRYQQSVEIMVVLPETQRDCWQELCHRYDFHVPHQVVSGGETRFHSVRNGLNALPAALDETRTLVAIHDGVRPLVTETAIRQCFEAAEKQGCAYPVIPVEDTLREKRTDGSVWVDRNRYFLVQTPQVFRLEIIKKAYRQAYSSRFTDDVSVVEALGEIRPCEVAGDRLNIKITTPADLVLAEKLLQLQHWI